MIRILFFLAFLSGVSAIMAMGAVFINTDMLALAIIGLIALAYGIGTSELFLYQKASASLQGALKQLPDFNQETQPPQCLDSWLKQLHVSLRYSVRGRIEGEHKGLPSPVLTPYLVGLLVMLGLLGTFAGMVDTLQGSVIALQGSSDLNAIREGLAAPIQGLGLAFGTSVAGVAASAMLGLMSTLARRKRIQVTRELDALISTKLRGFSLNFNRQETYKALQQQAKAFPDVAQQLSQVVTHLDGMALRIEQTLTQQQEQFLERAGQTHSQLAERVGKGLEMVVQQSGPILAQQIQPLVENLLSQASRVLDERARETQEHLYHGYETHMQNLMMSFQKTTETLQDQWQSAIDKQCEGFNAHLSQMDMTSKNLLARHQEAEQSWQHAYHESLSTLREQHQAYLAQWREQEKVRADSVFAQLESLETKAAERLAALGASLEVPMATLIETASEAPKAAAEVITRLKQEMTTSLERDNALMEDRRRIMSELDEVSEKLAASALKQSDAMASQINDTAEILKGLSERFEERIDKGLQQVSDSAGHVSASSLDIASMSEAFLKAVHDYGESNVKLVNGLHEVQEALQQSAERNDAQLAYYVDQAREIIDHSMLSQKSIIEEINRLAHQRAEASDA